MDWQYERRNGKWTKPPINPASGKHGSHSDATTWGTFETAWDAYHAKPYDGVGFVLTDADPYTAVDLDKCRNPEAGHIDDWARAIIQRLASYTEVSPSGRGVRIFIRGVLPPSGRRKGQIEVYDTLRYVTLTGQQIAGTPSTIGARQAELEAWHAEVWPPPVVTKLQPAAPVDLDDATLLERMWAAKNSPAIRQLWDGDTNGHDHNASSADLALCNHLAFYTGRDAARMDRLFRLSGLCRPKWDESHYANGETYGQRTIAVACAGTPETYRAPAPRHAPMPIMAGGACAAPPRNAPPPPPRQDATSTISSAAAEILRLRAALDQRDARIAQLEQANTHLKQCARDLHEIHTATLKIIHTKQLRHRAPTLIAVAKKLASATRRGQVEPSGWMRVTQGKTPKGYGLADETGRSGNSVGADLDYAAEKQMLRKQLRDATTQIIDPTTGEILERKIQVAYVAADGAEQGAAALLLRWAAMADPQPERRGGRRLRRPHCPDHPDARLQRVHELICTTCSQVVDVALGGTQAAGADAPAQESSPTRFTNFVNPEPAPPAVGVTGTSTSQSLGPEPLPTDSVDGGERDAWHGLVPDAPPRDVPESRD